jgi:ppGpp synthetase/RelA/SpoT-type nucleotidyltranferase
VVADICERWTIRRVREYVDGRDPGPKPDGYRAVHVVVVKDGRHIEVQLRTPWQDTWAQSVEQDTRRLAQGLKFGAGPDDLREYYQLISEYLALREQHETPSQEFMQALAKLYDATRRYFPEQTT